MARTVATAGRTVVVSGVTVALALTSLMLFQPVFLRSMGYGGVATVAVDMTAALTVLPALLAVLGHRVNALAVRRSVRTQTAKSETEGGWYRLAQFVMRRPVAFVVVIVVVLLTLGTPFLHISWGGTDARMLPASSAVRQVEDALATDFPANSTNVPATMRLLGRANWWAPAPLRRLYARYGITESETDESTAVKV